MGHDPWMPRSAHAYGARALSFLSPAHLVVRRLVRLAAVAWMVAAIYRWFQHVDAARDVALIVMPIAFVSLLVIDALEEFDVAPEAPRPRLRSVGLAGVVPS